MHVSELATKLFVTPDTVRYYTRIRLLRPKVNSNNGYKCYGVSDQSRLKFILAARNLGFSVEDITEILAETDHQRSPCSLVRQLIKQRLEENEIQFHDMVALRERMLAASKQWDFMSDQPPSEILSAI